MLQFTPDGFLTPVGKITSDLTTLEQVFVKDFPKSTTRQYLWANYMAFIEQFKRVVTNNFVQWINGSFVTKKENPNDIDLVTLIDYRIFETMEATRSLEPFWSYNLEKQGLDSYLLGVYPTKHPEFPVYQYHLNNWLIKYTNAKVENKPVVNVKGYVELIFSE